MIMTFLGENSGFLPSAFFGDFGELDISLLSANSTTFVTRQTDTGDVTTFTGVGFTYAADGDPADGTITGLSFSTSGTDTATITDIMWNLNSFVDSLIAIDSGDFGDFGPAAALFSASGAITVTATGASSGFDMGFFTELSFVVTAAMTVNGSRFDDFLMGGIGSDTLDGGAGADSFDGGAGIDTVTYASATRSVRVDLQNDAFMFGDAIGDTFTNVEIFRAGNGIDQLRGDAGDNIFYGGGSVDRLYGRAGDDFLDGESGIDAIYGGTGADTMTGGDGSARDRFIYFNIAESGVGAGNRDIITDFVSGEDRIEISRFDADTTIGRNQAFDFVGTSAFSGDAGELRYTQAGGVTVIQADTNGDQIADFEIQLSGTVALSAADFLL